MKLRALEISNYKSFELGRLDDFSLVNAITGPNNEGKSSVLEAISLLGFRHNVVPGRELNQYLQTRSIQGEQATGIRLKIDTSLSRQDLETIGIDRSAYQAANIRGIQYDFIWGINAPRKITDASALVPVAVNVMLPDGKIINWSKIQEGAPSNFVIADGGLMALLQGDSRRIDTPNSNALWAGHSIDWSVFQIFDDWARNLVWIPVHREVNTDGSLGNAGALSSETIAPNLLRMEQNRPELFAEFVRVLNILVPTVSNVYVTIEGSQGLAIRVNDRPTDAPQAAPRLDHAGGGVAELIFLVSGIWQAPNGSTILVEEPERGLHPGAQRRFLSAVLEHCQKYDKQVFWTTHSSVLAPIGSDTSSTIISFDDSNRSQAISVTRSDAKLIRSALGISPSDIYQHELILIVDGETEVEFFNELLAERFGLDKMNTFYVKAIHGDLESKKEHIAIALSLSASSSTTIFLLADHDGDVEKAIKWISKNIETPTDFELSKRIHVWDCGLKGIQRGAEFEDNFELSELIEAANNLAAKADLKVPNLKRQLADKNHLKISKVLSDYYFRTYEFELSKPKLAQELAEIAKLKIKSDQQRGTSDGRYEFEDAFDKIEVLISTP